MPATENNFQNHNIEHYRELWIFRFRTVENQTYSERNYYFKYRTKMVFLLEIIGAGHTL